MTDRVERVTLIAEVSNYVAGMERSSRSTTKMSQQATEALRKNREAWDQLGHAALAGGALVGVGFVAAVKSAADFDQAMANVQADTHETAANMDLLRDAAIDAGAKTVFSATEAANAIDELEKAGVSTADVVGGGLAGSLDLASAGGLGVAEAAGIAASTLTQFGLSGTDMGHVADLLAAGAGKAQGSVQDLGEALNNVGTIAHNTGLSVDETTGFLAAMASYGLTGAEAGTQLKSMLQSLQGPSSVAKKAMEELGISLYDQQGKTKSLTQFVGEYHDALDGKTQAEKDAYNTTIFGSFGIQAATVAYNEGADGIQNWIDKVDDSGYAAETARAKLDSLNGDLEQLGGSLDTNLIKGGTGANDTLRGAVQQVTALLNAYGELPDAVQGNVVVLGGIAAAAALAGGAFIIAVPKVVAFRAAMSTLRAEGVSFGKTFGIGGGVLIALTAATAGFANMGSTATLTEKQIADLDAAVAARDPKALDDLFPTSGGGLQGDIKGLKDNLDQLTTYRYNYDGAKFFDGFFLGLTHASDAGKEAEAQFKQLGQELADMSTTDLPGATAQFNEYVKAAGGGKDAAQRLLDVMEPYSAALTEAATAQGVTLTSAQLLDVAMGKTVAGFTVAKPAVDDAKSAIADTGAAAQDASGDVSKLSDELRNFGNTTLDSRSAQRDFKAAVDGARASLKETAKELKMTPEAYAASHKALDISTEKGRQNQAALDGVAKSANALAAAVFDESGSIQKANGPLKEGRDKFVELATAMGMGKDEAQKLADKIIALPKNATTAYKQTGLDDVETKLRRIKQLMLEVSTPVKVRAIAGGSAIARASGGILPGSPSATDNMLIHAASGEFITRSAQAAIPANRAALEYMNAGGVIRGYADGGLVGWQRATPAVTMQPAGLAPAVEGATAGGGQFSLTLVNPVYSDPIDEALMGHDTLRSLYEGER